MALYRVNKAADPQAKFHVKKNDEVVVLSGSQRGQRGKILQILRNRHRVIVEGVNFIKKAARKSQEQPQGGIIEREGTLHLSNVMLASDYDKRRGATKTETAPKAAKEKPAPKGKK